MTALDALLATPAPLRAWLEKRREGALVGVSKRKCACPIYRFLAAQRFPVWRVWGSGIQTEDGRMVDTEEWVFQFIKRIDSYGGTLGVPISRETAIHVLAEVEAL